MHSHTVFCFATVAALEVQYNALKQKYVAAIEDGMGLSKLQIVLRNSGDWLAGWLAGWRAGNQLRFSLFFFFICNANTRSLLMNRPNRQTISSFGEPETKSNAKCLATKESRRRYGTTLGGGWEVASLLHTRPK